MLQRFWRPWPRGSSLCNKGNNHKIKHKINGEKRGTFTWVVMQEKRQGLSFLYKTFGMQINQGEFVGLGLMKWSDKKKNKIVCACEIKEKYEVFSSITRHSQGKISLRFSPQRETVLQPWRVVFVFSGNLKLVINLRNEVINII